jgi:hypothetical protein
MNSNEKKPVTSMVKYIVQMNPASGLRRRRSTWVVEPLCLLLCLDKDCSCWCSPSLITFKSRVDCFQKKIENAVTDSEFYSAQTRDGTRDSASDLIVYSLASSLVVLGPALPSNHRLAVKIHAGNSWLYYRIKHHQDVSNCQSCKGL